ncbi:MAG: alpha/beta hydrolase [Microthrixaceae bacterium]|nr:alpha/beta hydrolase [Microthrixaceae bacterium]
MSIETQDTEADGPDQSVLGARTSTPNDRRQRAAGARRTGTRWLSPISSDPRIRFGVAAGVAALWGLIAGRWTPRGPLTSGEAIWSIVISLVVGAVAGLVARSRWALALAPVGFLVVFEITRLGADGPMVDGLHFGFLGMVAFVTGRCVHALLSLMPMLLGVVLGAGAARTIDPGPSTRASRVARVGRRSIAGLATVGLVALTVALVRPARTAEIVDADGKPVAGSIAELTSVDVNGHNLGMMIRGHNVDNPVLLFLAGGPGGTEFGAMRRHLPELEKHFTVATWDQRGSGTSYPELDPTSTITLDGYVEDTVAVTNYLRERFGQDRIYLAGQSWGTTLGVLAVQQRPALYRAFIGTGQMVSQRETDKIFYDDALAWARETGNDGLVDQLESNGPPPYDDITMYETSLANEQEVYAYDHSANSEGEAQMSENLFVEEYALIDQIHVLGGFMDTFSVLYPQLQTLDFRETATTFDILVFFVQGAHEADGRADVFAEWYPQVEAPDKDLIILDTSGHRPLFEQPDAFVDFMTTTVLTRTRDD